MTSWPDQRPDLPFLGHGWFPDENRRALAARLGPETRTVVEIGTWLGLSARFICDCAPAATLYAVDHWQGLPEPEWKRLAPDPWAQFVRDSWDYRHRIVPVRLDSWAGIEWLAAAGVTPDLVYIDGGHEYDRVLGDIERVRAAWPRAAIVGDDWTWPGVRRAVETAFTTFGVEGNCWWVDGGWRGDGVVV